MSSPRVGSKDFLDLNEIKAWANVSREWVVRHTAEDMCLDTQVEYAAILLSWCGPEQSEAIVLKSETGAILRNAAGEAQPARHRDLARLLGVGKSSITRTVQALVERKTLRFEGKVMYLNLKPPPLSQDEKVVVHSNFSWNIGGVVVVHDNLPTDPAARQNAIQLIEELSARWKNERNNLNARYRELLRTGLSGAGILIEKSSKSLREERGASSSSLEDSALPATTTPPPVDIKVSSPPEPEPPAAPAPDEAEEVLEAMRAYRAGDLDAARQVIAECRRLAPEASAVADIVLVVHEKGAILSRRKDIASRTGFFIGTVPKCFDGRKPPPPRPPECPECHGSGRDQTFPQDPCEMCGGTGKPTQARVQSISG